MHEEHTINKLPDSARRLALRASAASAFPLIARAQAWPNKSIRFVVPFAPGGSSEIVARAAAAELSKTLGQSMYVDNKPGGAPNVAKGEVARAEDQHTLSLGHIGTLAVNPYIFDKLPYDPVKDFQPISLPAKVPSLYVVHPDVAAKNLKEFVALRKARPGQLNYGSAGNGSAGHLAFEYLEIVTNTFILHVPYRGTGPQLTDLLAGRLQAASVGAPAIMQFLRRRPTNSRPPRPRRCANRPHWRGSAPTRLFRSAARPPSSRSSSAPSSSAGSR